MLINILCGLVGILAGFILAWAAIMGAARKVVVGETELRHREILESWDTGHDIMEANGRAIERIAEAIASVSGSHPSPDMVLLPKELTAENGAKGLLIGEFFEDFEYTCPTCGGEGGLIQRDEDEDPCESCNDDGVLIAKVPISWPTIKAIYKKIVEHYGK